MPGAETQAERTARLILELVRARAQLAAVEAYRDSLSNADSETRNALNAALATTPAPAAAGA